MPEDDGRLFGEVYDLYNKYRWTEMQTEQQWMDLSNDVLILANKYHWSENPLAMRLCIAILDAIGDMYKDGKKPPMPDYFGRTDLA